MITGEYGPALLAIAVFWAWGWMLITILVFMARERKAYKWPNGAIITMLLLIEEKLLNLKAKKENEEDY